MNESLLAMPAYREEHTRVYAFALKVSPSSPHASSGEPRWRPPPHLRTRLVPPSIMRSYAQCPACRSRSGARVHDAHRPELGSAAPRFFGSLGARPLSNVPQAHVRSRRQARVGWRRDCERRLPHDALRDALRRIHRRVDSAAQHHDARTGERAAPHALAATRDSGEQLPTVRRAGWRPRELSPVSYTHLTL